MLPGEKDTSRKEIIHIGCFSWRDGYTLFVVDNGRQVLGCFLKNFIFLKSEIIKTLAQVVADKSRTPIQRNGTTKMSPCLRQSDETGQRRTLWRCMQNELSWLSAATYTELMATSAHLRRAGGDSLHEAGHWQRRQTEPHRTRQGCPTGLYRIERSEIW